MNRPTSHPLQLDLFIHSGAVVFANDALEALRRRDIVKAADCIRRIVAEDPAYRALVDLQTLCQAVRDWPFPASSPGEISLAARRLETEVQPAASSLMRGEAESFIRPFWRDLASLADQFGYDAEFPQAFSAALRLRCGDHREAAEAVESVAGWNENPDLVGWLVLARHGTGGLDACRWLLMRLALLAPVRLPAIMDEIDSPNLKRDWVAFRNACNWFGPRDAEANAWFPAWYLIEHSDSRIAPDAFPATTSPAAQAFVLVDCLCKLEKRGYSAELVSVRSRLREVAPELFAIYMSQR